MPWCGGTAHKHLSQNEFWNSEKIGIYVDIITGQPLFASADKFDGHVGLPTFTKPISKDILIEVPDNTNEMQRTQVRAKRSNARLGHVFPDPQSPTGQRYVVYSAAFHFVPVEQLKDRGYEASFRFSTKSRLTEDLRLSQTPALKSADCKKIRVDPH